MVAIFVVLTIIAFLLVDYLVQKFQARHNDSGHTAAIPLEPVDCPLEMMSADSIAVPSSFFFHRGHTWIKFSSPALGRVGLDDFAQKILEKVDTIQFPKIGREMHQGDPLFMVRVGGHRFFLPSPSDGMVTHVNTELALHPEHLHSNPYDGAWICEIKPKNISQNIRELLSGEQAVRWELHELSRLQQFLASNGSEITDRSDEKFSLARLWENESSRGTLAEFSQSFFALDPDRAELMTEVF